MITGFGRIGTAFAAERFGVMPDIMTMAKGLTNAAVPMGAVAAARTDLRRDRGGRAGSGIELSTAIPIPAIRSPAPAAIATMDLHRSEDLPGAGPRDRALLGGGGA